MPNDINIQTELTVLDIHLALQIFEICAKRGAFLPEEFYTIGNLFNKLNAIVKLVESDSLPNETAVSAETADVDDEQLELELNY